MNPTDITTAISTLGFPIVCCAAMFWQNMRITEQHKTEIQVMTEQHNTEMKGMQEAIQNNTIVMTEIRDTLRELSENKE